jgi:glutathione S-transferase
MASGEAIRLYSGPLSMFGAKAEIALGEKGIAFDLVMVPFAMRTLYEPKHPEVLRINPKRQVPVLVHGGLELFDSTQIFEYLEDLAPEPALWPMEPAGRARARQLEMLSDEVYFPHIVRLFGLQDAPEDPVTIAAKAGAAAFYDRLEATIGDEPYLAGPFSYADIAFYMAQIFGERMGAPIGEGRPRLIAWRERMGGRAPVRKVAGAMGRWLVGQGRPLPAFLAALT